MVAVAAAQEDHAQQYEGPSILSRDKSLLGERGGKLIDFRYYGELNGVYDTGLAPVAVDQGGNPVNIGASYGAEAGFGVLGSRTWRRDALSLEYHGTYRHYVSNSLFNGTDQFLNLAYRRILSRRISLNLKETVGTTSLANGFYSFVPLTDTDKVAVPTNELFDNRTNFLESRVDLTWQKSARLSFSAGGEGFIVRRRSLALVGLQGYSARADVAYRVTRRQTVSLNYGYSSYDYQRTFGSAIIQSLAGGYSFGLSRRWDFSSQAGILRVNTLGLQTTILDPAVAAIVGQTAVTTTFNRTVYAPLGEVRLIRRFDKSSLNFTYSTGVTPGNGVYLTSKQNVGTIDYSYVGFRRFTASASASYGTLSAVGQTIGKYTNYQNSAGFTYRLIKDAHLDFRYDYRHYTTQNTVFQKDSQRVTLGIAYSPGEKPLAIW